MATKQLSILFAVLCLLFKTARCDGEDATNGCGCACGGFGFEVLLAKLENIEAKLEALEERLQNPVSPAAQSGQAAGHTDPKVRPESAAGRVSESLEELIDTPPVAPKHPMEMRMKPIGINPTPEQRTYGEGEIYSSCREVPVKVNGHYLIRTSKNVAPMNLLCDMQSMPDAGWIVIQQRFNGSESFYRSWSAYRDGFGSMTGEFWLGLNRISRIVSDGRRWEIAVWMMTFSRLVRYAKFDNFSLGNATDQFTLKRVGQYSGNAGDSLTVHVGQKFTTYDRDNDQTAYNCAKKHRGGWWYHKLCISSNLNGEYDHKQGDQSNSWATVAPGSGMQATKIMIREL